MSSTAEPQIKAAPPSRITINVSPTEQQEVFMSFALLNELTPLIGGPERTAEFDFDAVLRQHTLILCLGTRDARRKIVEDYMLPETLEMDQAEILIDWVKEHVLNFFIRRLVKNIQELKDNAEALRLTERLPKLPTG